MALMYHKEQARVASLRGYISVADFYERYWTINGKPPPPLRRHEREILDAIEASQKKQTNNTQPTLIPVQMASMNQRRVLLGLQAGLKLHEVLREPHMPSAKMIDEWRTVPEFDHAFVTASTEGAAYRAKQLANRPTVKAATLAAELVSESNQPTLIQLGPGNADLRIVAGMEPLVDENFRVNGALEMTPLHLSPPQIVIIEPEEIMSEPVILATYPLVIAEAATKQTLTSSVASSPDDALKQELMRRLRTGEPSKLITKSTSGFYADKLSEWRKNADFVVEWNKAKAVGRDTRKTNSYLIERLTQLAAEAVSEPLFERIPQPTPAETAPVPAPVNPAHEYLPEHKPENRFFILKAETSFEFLMSEAEARQGAAQYTAESKDAYYVAQLVAVSTPMTTAIIFPID